MLNDLIKWVYEQGLSGIVYKLFFVVAVLISAFFNIWYCKKYNIRKTKAFFMTLLVNIIDWIWMVVYCWILSGFDSFGGGNAVKIFIFVPLWIFLIAKIFKENWLKAWDFMAPSRTILFGIGKLACTFAGCCYGYSFNWGIYNPQFEKIVFPIQLLELMISFAITAFLIVRAREQNYRVDGLSLPLMLILFGTTRFILEFARNNEKIWLGCSDMSFHALFVVIVGVIMYVIIKRHNSANPEIVEETLLNSEIN